MMFFKQFFKDVVFDDSEVAVRCPFPHFDEDGNRYYEEHASAHINTDKGTLHCKVCGEGYSETKFLAKVNGISYRDASKLIAEIERVKSDDWEGYRKNFYSSDAVQDKVRALGISDEVTEELQLGYMGGGFSFPVFMYGELLDVRTYNSEHVKQGYPKVMSKSGAHSNLIVPFDVWQESDEDTFIMAGEKDMALARTIGLNAITFTGGEQAFPKLFKASFRGKKCYIVYDNDEAGKTGARKTATLLREAGATPFIVEGHHKVCVKKGEDFHDYIRKYGKTKQDFDEIIAKTAEFTQKEFEEEKEKIIPTIQLLEATQGKYRNKLVRSSVQVTATFDQTFGISDFIEAVKIEDDNQATMSSGDKKEWSLDDSNMEDILLLMDSKLRDDQVTKNYKKIAGVPPAEKYISVRKISHDTVFKATVTDLVESDVHRNDYKTPLEVVAYSVGHKLQSGMKYKLTYKMIPHPLQEQQNVMMITHVEASDDSVSTFQITEPIKESLQVFQGEPETKMEEIFERAKGLIGSFANREIYFSQDLVFHTPLEFMFGEHNIRGVLDVMVVGESRTGKSATAEALIKTYQLGTFTTLKNATVAGIVGGSNKVGGSFKTMVGTIPRNHKGLIVFEEFSGASPDFIKAITDIRSSGQVRLTRVVGEMKLPATVRMITISNQKVQSDNNTKPLRSYPNGVSVLTELVGAAEDIARYDFFCLIEGPQDDDDFIDPLAKVEAPFPIESYLNRVRWVWSRKKDQIIFDTDVDRYIVKKAMALNHKYKSHIKFFGTEAWKKVAKVAVAVAGMVVSTDESYEKLIVKKEHVDWAVNFMVSLYDNDLFRLKQYVDEQNRYVETNDDCILRVQQMYAQHTTLLKQMETSSSMTARNLQAISGLDQKEFSVAMNEMASLMLFQWKGNEVVPSERFRRSMAKINRNTHVKRIGEI